MGARRLVELRERDPIGRDHAEVVEGSVRIPGCEGLPAALGQDRVVVRQRF